MKIYYFSNSIIPSNQANTVHVMKMCNALSGLVNGVILYGRQGEVNFSNKHVKQQYDVDGDFEIVRINQKFTRKTGNLQYLYTLNKIMKDPEKDDVFYGRDLFSLFMLRNKGISIFYEAHAFPFSKLRVNMERKLVKSPNFKKLIVISESLKKKYIREFPNLTDEDISVLHDGADITEIEVNAKFKDNNFNVGYVGSLYPGKGMEIILELSKIIPDVKFHIIGGSVKEIKDWKDKITNQSNIIFYGQVPFDQTESYRQAMDVLIAPYSNKVYSKGNQEITQWMSPLKLFEYMASQKPIIASDIPVIREVLNKDNSFLCHPNNLDCWKDNINLIKNKSEENIEKKVRNAYVDLVDNYTWSARAVKLKRILDFVVGKV
ncbi:glycosyltransferase [Alkalicoccus chagannorensis]|uniref:glycosyltransferase n=1 Tax=Alkalicoccus chagannorensis TaxID=427072 RepID=UPI00041AE671|nr:glycosyltransferase [Alkalicoccus chagannorensis]